MLLSSLFVYNQMGGIDEAALDRLSLVTEVRQPHSSFLWWVGDKSLEKERVANL